MEPYDMGMNNKIAYAIVIGLAAWIGSFAGGMGIIIMTGLAIMGCAVNYSMKLAWHNRKERKKEQRIEEQAEAIRRAAIQPE